MELILKISGFNLLSNLLNKIRNEELRRFVSFFLTAILGAGTNFLSQIPYKSLFLSFGFPDDPAFTLSVFMGYLTATVVSFIPAKVFAFSAKESGNTRRESIKFLVIATVALGIQVIVADLSKKYIANIFFTEYSLFLREKFSHLIGMGFSFLANYYGHKFLTFRSTGIYDKFKTKGNR